MESSNIESEAKEIVAFKWLYKVEISSLQKIAMTQDGELSDVCDADIRKMENLGLVTCTNGQVVGTDLGERVYRLLQVEQARERWIADMRESGFSDDEIEEISGWMEQGFTEEQINQKLEERQREEQQKLLMQAHNEWVAGMRNAGFSYSEIEEISGWMEQGYSEKEINQKLQERQELELLQQQNHLIQQQLLMQQQLLAQQQNPQEIVIKQKRSWMPSIGLGVDLSGHSVSEEIREPDRTLSASIAISQLSAGPFRDNAKNHREPSGMTARRGSATT
jgi:hypothetical protein